MKNDNVMRYVIIGASAAGMAAAQTIRETDCRGRVTILTEESDPPYFRPLIPYLISGKKSAAQMMLSGKGPYTAGDITVNTGVRVAGIDGAQKIVRTAKGMEIPFDRLLIATGSRPHLPPEIENTAATGVFTMRTLAHARAASVRAETARHAVMLGGGLLNLKTAFALLEKGIRVTLVVFSPEVLSQLMEPRDAARIRAALDAAGLKILTGKRATAVISGAGGVQGVLLNDGERLACEMVFIGKGGLPNTGFLKESQLCMDGGVVADRHTATSDANIFAAGDVAVTFDPVTQARVNTGLWTNAVEMGRCAGFNMAGQKTVYSGTFGIMNATQIANEPFVSMGVVHTLGTAYETHIASGKNFYRKIVFSPDGARLAGAVLSGNITGAGLLRLVMRERKPVAAFKHAVINGTLNYGHFLR
ncbi:MAG: FAD-dependent oxidoreductase [Desulfobacterales bacterium]|jgi:NAD(P)H-nitrite reductase large subunit|nr:FAD-dependent oxidoreductase [Desulfobacterales bacterium]